MEQQRKAAEFYKFIVLHMQQNVLSLTVQCVKKSIDLIVFKSEIKT